jgi:hypothetical protein
VRYEAARYFDIDPLFHVINYADPAKNEKNIHIYVTLGAVPLSMPKFLKGTIVGNDRLGIFVSFTRSSE